MWIWGVVELYVAIIAASAPALRPFLRNFLVNPLKSIAAATTPRQKHTTRKLQKRSNISKGGHESKRSLYRSHASSNKSRRSLRESALMDDLEDLGIAYGGKDALTSWNDHIDIEIDNDELETRRCELQHRKDGKFAMAQVWHARPQTSDSAISQKTGNTFPARRPVSTPASETTPPPAYTHEADPGLQVRNFSLPYYSTHTAPTTPRRHSLTEKSLSWHSQKTPPSAHGRAQLQFPLPALPAISAFCPRRQRRMSMSQHSSHV